MNNKTKNNILFSASSDTIQEHELDMTNLIDSFSDTNGKFDYREFNNLVESIWEFSWIADTLLDHRSDKSIMIAEERLAFLELIWIIHEKEKLEQEIAQWQQRILEERRVSLKLKAPAPADYMKLCWKNLDRAMKEMGLLCKRENEALLILKNVDRQALPSPLSKILALVETNRATEGKTHH